MTWAEPFLLCRYILTYSVTSPSGLSAVPLQTSVAVWETGAVSFSVILIHQNPNQTTAEAEAQVLTFPGSPPNLGLRQAVGKALTSWLQDASSLSTAKEYLSQAKAFTELYNEQFLAVSTENVNVTAVSLYTPLSSSIYVGNNSITAPLTEVSISVRCMVSSWLVNLPWAPQTLVVSSGSASNVSARRRLWEPGEWIGPASCWESVVGGSLLDFDTRNSGAQEASQVARGQSLTQNFQEWISGMGVNSKRAWENVDLYETARGRMLKEVDTSSIMTALQVPDSGIP